MIFTVTNVVPTSNLLYDDARKTFYTSYMHSGLSGDVIMHYSINAAGSLSSLIDL